MNDVVKMTTGYMAVSAILGVALGLLMLFYPGGTMVLMQSAFMVFQWLLSIFILYWALTEAAHYFKTRHVVTGVGYGILGLLAVILVWSFGVGIVFLVVSGFLLLSGLGEIISSFRDPQGTLFLTFLGIIDVFVGVLVIKNPLILPLLIAWYVLFWGISRLMLSLELRRLLAR
jgi:uncharacterized membrane protein HdeD (DUF308 family)